MAIDDGVDRVRKSPAVRSRGELSEWVDRVYKTLRWVTRGEAARRGQELVSPATRISRVLRDLRVLLRQVPAVRLRTRARRLNKVGPVGFPPEPSGLEAMAGTVAAVLWAAELTRDNGVVPEELSRALGRPIARDQSGIPLGQAEEFLALLHGTLDRRVLAEARAQALYEAEHLRWRRSFGQLPDLPEGRRLWMVTLAKLLMERRDGVGHNAIRMAAGKSMSWSKHMVRPLRELGYLPKKSPTLGESMCFSAKGWAWVRQHEPHLAQ